MQDTTPNLKPADSAAILASGEAERIAESLSGTAVGVATFDAAGQLRWTSPQTAMFFKAYALPAIQLLGLQTAGPELQLDHHIAGITVCALPAPARRSSQPLVVLVARRADFDARSEDVQRLCSRLQVDARWLAAEAADVAPVDPAVLLKLAQLAPGHVRAETKLGSLQQELDSLSGQLSDTYEELTLIYQISSGMRINRSVDDFFLQACMEVIDVMGVRGAGYVVTDANGRADAAAVYGEVQIAPDVNARLTDDLLRLFRESPTPMLINDLASDATLHYLSPSASRMVAVPIQRQDKVLGTIFCVDKADRDFTTQDSKLLNSIGNETAIYLENSALFTDARGLMMGLLHALTSAVDAKDAYTCGHSQRVALFGREIATAAGLREGLAERVYMAGLLHDVGKIGVPEEVLRKPGKLTTEEFDLMKKHVDIGARILKDVRQIEDLIPGVLYHHERYDGKGYPQRLSGQQIPLIARILCVADCFDAMTSNRTYRKALPIEVALMEIRRCSGTQFDPLLADAFLSIGATRLRELIGSVTDQMAIQIAA